MVPATIVRQPPCTSRRASAAPHSGFVPSSPTTSRRVRPRMPPSALTSSTAIAARFAVAAANTLPGPDLLVSSPRRWSRRSVGSRTRYPRRRMSQRRPSSSRSATTRTRVPLPSGSKRSRSVPRQGTSRWMSIRPGRRMRAIRPSSSTGGPPSGARSATAAPGASRSHTVSNSQPAPAPAPTRSNTALGGASIRCSTERARPAIRWLGRPERRPRRRLWRRRGSPGTAPAGSG